MRARPARRGGLDLLRVIGVIAVVAGHTWTGEATHTWVYAWHVPVFFVLAGWLMRAERPIAAEVAQRFRTLMLPYIVWFAAIATLAIGVGTLDGTTLDAALLPHMLLGGSNAQGPFATVWFVSALLFATIAARLVLRIGMPWWGIAVAAAALFGLATAWGTAVDRWLLAIGTGSLSAAWLLAGHLAARASRPASMSRRMQGVVGAALVAAGFVTIGVARPSPIDIKVGELGTPGLGVLIALAITIGAILVVESFAMPPRMTAVVSWLATPAMVVVLVHPLILWMTDGVLPDALRCALALLVPWCVALLLAATRLSRITVGTAMQPLLPRLQT